MPTKLELKNKAMSLRNQGYSYGDIFRKTNVPKSTLSDWLKYIKLTKDQSSNLDKRVKRGQMLGAKAARDKRLHTSKEIKDRAIKEIGSINKTEMLMLGAMLYWGEGSKQSDRNISQPVEFVNSDSRMCRFFIKWIIEIIGVDSSNLVFRVYINETKKNNSEMYKKIWSNIIKIPSQKIKIYFTKDRQSNLKRANRNNYIGQLRIVVNKSTNLNRRIMGLVDGICLQSGLIH